MFWGPQQARAAGGFAEELAAFVRGRGDHGPAVLWPEYDPPSDAGGAPGPRLAARLTELVGRPVVDLPGGPQREGRPLEPGPGGLLLVQTGGTSCVHLSADPAAEEPRQARIRVRPGEVLFLPRDARAVLHHGAGARHILLRIDAGPRQEDKAHAPSRDA
ncbi:hypothetical protein [Streptacidiphilus monticola]|uniref:Cupin domain-containing protein n=1 Tax=Streptacidiphilus monticola TaxID=2161674 RepID=A0ABW1G7W2_9ACTN